MRQRGGDNSMTPSAVRALFDPVSLGALHLPHRIAMAPMTRYRADERGCVGALGVEYYRQRAQAAMIVSETNAVHPAGRIGSYVAGLYAEAHVTSWSAVTEAVHQQGGRMVAQLMHGGRVSHPSLQPDGEIPVAPSGVAIEPPDMVRTSSGDRPTVAPRALAVAEISEIVEAYGRAAQNARRAGFDAVELHAGNGYLPAQFLSSRSNRRTDGYGGSPAARARFTLEVVEAVSGAVGEERMGVKVSPFMALHDGLDPASEENHAALLRELSGRRLAYVHVQLQFDFRPMLPQPFDPLALVRANYPGRVVAGGNLDRASGAKAIAEGLCDVIAFGRRFAANPDLPERMRLGAEENSLDAETLVGCGPDPRGYVDYPPLTEDQAGSMRSAGSAEIAGDARLS
jgi:N-ethylmaleimide reductase